MNSPLARTAKHAIVGSVVGEAVGFASTVVTTKTRELFKLYNDPVINGVIGGVVTAGFILAGDRVIGSVLRDDDPLYRMFYYQVAFHHSPAYGIADAARAFVYSFMKKPPMNPPPASRPPQYGPGPTIGKKCGDCTATGKSCSGCGGH